MAVDSGRILNRSWIVMVFLVTLVLVLVDPTTAATTYNLRSLWLSTPPPWPRP